MDVRSMYDKEYLYAYDLQSRDVTVVIERVKVGKLIGEGGKSNKKPVVYFKGKEKGLALNITNARIIASMYGGFEVESWIGKAITLYPTTTTFGSKTVDCIRIRPVIPGGNGRAVRSSTPTSSAPSAGSVSDEDEAARKAAGPTDEEIAAQGDSNDE